MLIHRHLHKSAKWTWWTNPLKDTDNHSWPEIACIFGGFVFTCVQRFVQVCAKSACMFDCLDWLARKIQMQDPPSCNPVLGLQLQSRFMQWGLYENTKGKVLTASRQQSTWRILESGTVRRSIGAPPLPSCPGPRHPFFWNLCSVLHKKAASMVPWGSVIDASRLINLSWVWNVCFVDGDLGVQVKPMGSWVGIWGAGIIEELVPKLWGL